MIITLSTEHTELAARVAEQRNVTQRTAGRADGIVSRSSIAADISGSLGEIAVALAFNLPWANALLSIEKWLLARDCLPDVGHMEVKATRHRNGCLLLQKHARPEPPYVLTLLHDLPNVTLAGWLEGRLAKQEKYWRTDVPKACFMVPQRDLKAMGELWPS